MDAAHKENKRVESLRAILFSVGIIFLTCLLQLRVAFSWSGDSVAQPGLSVALDALFSQAENESLFMQVASWLRKSAYLGPLFWQLLHTGIYYLNGLLAFLLCRKMRLAPFSVALAGAALVLMNPLGVEVFLLRCCLQKMLFITLLFSALLLLPYKKPLRGAFHAFLIALLQVVAAFIWDYGLLFFPLVALIYLCAYREGERKKIKQGAILALVPAALVWIVVSTLLITYRDPTLLPFLPLGEIAENLFFAPVEGLFPLMQFDTLPKVLLYMLAGLCYLILAAVSWKSRSALGLVLAFFLASLSWALFRTPVTSDFLVSMPFLYLAMTALDRSYGVRHFFLLVFLVFNFIWMFQRLEDLQSQVVRTTQETTAELERDYMVPYDSAGLLQQPATYSR